MAICRVGMLLVLCVSAALADPITWTLNATLDDSATVNGSFVFDPDIGFQTITSFNINISAATPGTLSEPGDRGLPTSTFFPFDFTPTNSTAQSPSLSTGVFTFYFASVATYPIPGFCQIDCWLTLGFVPLSH